jgi:hypothetical protein
VIAAHVVYDLHEDLSFRGHLRVCMLWRDEQQHTKHNADARTHDSMLIAPSANGTRSRILHARHGDQLVQHGSFRRAAPIPAQWSMDVACPKCSGSLIAVETATTGDPSGRPIQGTAARAGQQRIRRR